MRKQLVLALMAACMGTACMTGCGSASDTAAGQETSSAEASAEAADETQDAAKDADAAQETTESEGAGEDSTVEIANPWTESDEEGVAKATGFVMTPPDGAENVSYSYMEEGGLAQMSYELDGKKWTYRMQMTDGLTDISGIYMDWEGEEGNVSGREAMYYGKCDLNDENVEDVQLVNWYDAVTGVTYSLSATATDLNGMDIQAYAEALYVPLQQDATDDPAADRENELKDYFLGEHKRSDDGSSLVITGNGDDTFRVDLSITRLCSLENGTGSFAEHKMTFTAEDPNGNAISGVIYRDSDNSLVVKITDSTWDYLPSGEVLDGFGK